MSTDLKSKLSKLIESNNERVKKVDEMSGQIEQLKTGIATLKEQHDFTRGQISALQDLETDEDATTPTTDEKVKKG
jgi:peptidoglycan hydrolase CwlO-like protein